METSMPSGLPVENNTTADQARGFTNSASPSPAEITWQDICALAVRHKKRLVIANVTAFVAALLSIPVPLMMPLLVDEILLDKPAWILRTLDKFLPGGWHNAVAYILTVFLFTVVLRLASLGLQVIQGRHFALVSKDIIFHLRRRLIERLRSVSMKEYETLGGGTVASHLVVDLNTIDQFVGDTVSRLIMAILTLLGAAAVLLWMHWPLAVFLLLLNPVVVYFSVLVSKRVKELKRRENHALQVFQECITETLDAIHQIRASNREQHYLARVVAQARDIYTHAAAFAWQSDAANRFAFTVFLLGIDLFRGVAMLMVVFSDLSVGQMIAVFGYLWYMLAPVETIISLQYAWQASVAALERVNSLIHLADEPNYPERFNPFAQARTNALSLRGIRFRYDDGPLILDDVHLDIGAGESVAIVGASGGGKSTLAQIILGLYQPEAGEVLIDGVSVCQIGLTRVRRHVGIVMQHPALLNASVRENLSFGVAHSERCLWEALEVAQLADFIADSEAGLDTTIGRTGVRLSGGQRQRLAIARMLLADPNIVIIDEATSALDIETERRVHAALSQYLTARTMMIIAHRFSAIKAAARVYVFDGGRIVEYGTHEALIATTGYYQRLYGGSKK